MLRPIVAWHWVFGRTARQASLDYLDRLHRFSGGSTPTPTAANTYRHMLAFARAALDKFGAWIGRMKHSDIPFPAWPQLEALLAKRQGAILIGAHLGNLEMMRALAANDRMVTINAVVYTEHAQRFASTLAGASDNFRVNLLHVPHFGADTAIMLREKIDQGELLVIVGDRTPPAENGRVVSADFLGAPALFPQGPFILASLLECPVYLFFCVDTPQGYEAIFEPFAERITLPRGDRPAALARYAQQYAQRLERLCLAHPFQWFNFFDFWRSATRDAPPTPTTFARRAS